MNIDWYTPLKTKNYNKISASQWIRCLQLLPYLSELGIKSDLNPKNSNSSIAVFVRWQTNEAYLLAKELKAQGKKIIFDLCVNYYDESQVSHLKKAVSQEHVDQCMFMTDIADVITCSSKYICEKAMKYHNNVVYLPDSFDFKHFNIKKNHKDFDKNKITVVWSGVTEKLKELEPILGILSDRQLELLVITDKPIKAYFLVKKHQQLKTKILKWNYQSFPRNIVRGDVVVSYRDLNSLYNMGHSFYKIGIFMAEGIPALASPQPSYSELIKGGGGCICNSIEDWDLMLEKITKNRNTIKQLSERAYSNTLKYSTENISKKYLQVFKGIV